MIATIRWRGWRWAVVASGAPVVPGETLTAAGEIVWSWRRDRGVYPVLPVRGRQR
jgi:hypothetical protein